MKNKYLIIILAIQMMFLPAIAISEPIPKAKHISQGTRAPFDGLLLDSVAQSQAMAERETKKKLCDLEINYLKMRKDKDCKFQMDSLKIDVESLKKEKEAIYKIKDDQIDGLRQIALKSPSNNRVLWFTIGAGAGIIVTIAMFLLVGQVSKVD